MYSNRLSFPQELPLERKCGSVRPQMLKSYDQLPQRSINSIFAYLGSCTPYMEVLLYKCSWHVLVCV